MCSFPLTNMCVLNCYNILRVHVCVLGMRTFIFWSFVMLMCTVCFYFKILFWSTQVHNNCTIYDMDVDCTHKHIATVGQDRNLRIYDVTTSKELNCFKSDDADQGSVLQVGGNENSKTKGKKYMLLCLFVCVCVCVCECVCVCVLFLTLKRFFFWLLFSRWKLILRACMLQQAARTRHCASTISTQANAWLQRLATLR